MREQNDDARSLLRHATALAAALCLAGPAAHGLEVQDRVYFRAGATHLAPQVDSDDLVISGIEPTDDAALALDNGPLEGARADVGSTTAPSVTVGYVLPWLDDRLALETVLAPPLTVDFLASGRLRNESLVPEVLDDPTDPTSDGIPTGIPALGRKLGETRALPPLLTAVYRFGPDHSVVPYAGAGATYVYSYDSEITNPVLTEVSRPSFEVSPTFGYVLQAGLESEFAGGWWANLDVKFVGGATVTGTVENIVLDTEIAGRQVVLDRTEIDVTLNPWVIQAGVGYTF